MRTTVELPDDLLLRAKLTATQCGVSLKEFFIEAVENRLAARKAKPRRPPPVIGSVRGRRIRTLTAKQLDEAMFG